MSKSCNPYQHFQKFSVFLKIFVLKSLKPLFGHLSNHWTSQVFHVFSRMTPKISELSNTTLNFICAVWFWCTKIHVLYNTPDNHAKEKMCMHLPALTPAKMRTKEDSFLAYAWKWDVHLAVTYSSDSKMEGSWNSRILLYSAINPSLI